MEKKQASNIEGDIGPKEQEEGIMTVCEFLDQRQVQKEGAYENVLEFARDVFSRHTLPTAPVSETARQARGKFPGASYTLVQLAVNEAFSELDD